MKKIWFILIAPFLLATQCESDEDPVFRTEYYVQNDSTIDLLWITDEDREFLIEAGARQFLSVASDSEAFISPSQSRGLTSLVLYSSTGSDNEVVYSQEDIQDELWTFSSSTTCDAEYVLFITNELLDSNAGF
ncbi:hypothetical protein [Croceiramulus getboli]|nr:hypothetical protein P8624_10840 [Flavobacteriaceae bacterium YJPT1-3]